LLCFEGSIVFSIEKPLVPGHLVRDDRWVVATESRGLKGYRRWQSPLLEGQQVGVLKELKVGEIGEIRQQCFCNRKRPKGRS